MKKVSEIVQRIESCYVGDDCLLVMVPYENALTILNQDGIIYSHKEGSHVSINKYVEDERRKQFPYSNIPTHHSRIGLFGKINYTNQLLNFEEPYIRIGDNKIIESFAVKDKNEALIINEILTGDVRTIYLNREELEELFSNSSSKDKKKYIIYLDDESINIGDFHPLLSEEQIYNFVKSEITKNVAEFRRYVNNNSLSLVGSYLLQNPLFLDFVEQNVQDFDLNKMKLNIELKGGKAIILKSNGYNITLHFLSANFVSPNNYRVNIVDIPVNKYTLEKLKLLSPKIVKTKEPKISLKLNPGISKEAIEEAKQMVRSLKK